MENRVTIIEKKSEILDRSVVKDFEGVLNQYHDFRNLRNEYYYLTGLGLLIITILSMIYSGFGIDPNSNDSVLVAKIETMGPLPSLIREEGTIKIPYPDVKEMNVSKLEKLNEGIEKKKSSRLNIEEIVSPEPNLAVEIKLSSRAEPLDGFPNLYEYFSSNLTYPEVQAGDSIEGIVKVAFTINTDSTISHLEVLESLGKAFDGEAIRLLKGMPKWKPAVEDNVPVLSSMIIPVRFEIEDDE